MIRGGTLGITGQIIKLYPNPASDKLMLEWQSDKTESGMITINYLLGRQLLMQSVISNAGPQGVDVSKLTDGTYLVWLKENKRAIYQSKVVIIK